MGDYDRIHPADFDHVNGNRVRVNGVAHMVPAPPQTTANSRVNGANGTHGLANGQPNGDRNGQAGVNGDIGDRTSDTNGTRRPLQAHDLIRADADFFVDDDDENDVAGHSNDEYDDGEGSENYFYYGDESSDEEDEDMEEESSEAEESEEEDQSPPVIHLTPAEIEEILGSIDDTASDGDYEDEAEDQYEHDPDEDVADGQLADRPPRSRRNEAGDRTLPTVPSEAGAALMLEGYGSNQHEPLATRRVEPLSEQMFQRGQNARDTESASRSTTPHFGREALPVTSTERIMHYHDRLFSGQFSDDAQFFYTVSQDSVTRMYDTSDPYNWKFHQETEHSLGKWSITEGALSPDNSYFALGTISNNVVLCKNRRQQGANLHLLDFAQELDGRVRFGVRIWSVRFSADGNELAAGTSANSVVVYDLNTQRQVYHASRHAGEVNAVCYGGKTSPHIIYSASEDNTVRVWDRRLRPDGPEAGCFVGHTEGVVYVDSRGDERYLLSNGKDQTMKLWDLRKMQSTRVLDAIGDPQQWSTGFNYGCDRFEKKDYIRHPHDSSVVTFMGHSVHKTTIKCHFSPPDPSNARYVYTGSEDGKVWIYNLDATVAATVDVEAITEPHPPYKSLLSASPAAVAEANASNPAKRRRRRSLTYSSARGNRPRPWRACVRDVAWHPHAPILVTSAWAGHRYSPSKGKGTRLISGKCTVHSWMSNPDAEVCRGDLYCDDSLRPLGVKGYNKRTKMRPPPADDAE